jgi:hypothetical protein
VAVPDFLRPVTDVAPRPKPAQQPGEAKYVRSYLVMRLGIGALGIVLPLWLVFADWLAFSGDPHPRGSLSVYYYSGMRDVFVMIMSATGVFLITHMVADKSLDNTATFFAGLCAILISLFPTGHPSYFHGGLTPLQDWWSEESVKRVHFGASAVFLVLLAVMSFLFGLREGRRVRRQGQHFPPRFWRWFHWACAIAMGLALIWIVVTGRVGSPQRSLLIGEWVSAWAFGASFLAKGAEWDMLLGKPSPPVTPAA